MYSGADSRRTRPGRLFGNGRALMSDENKFDPNKFSDDLRDRIYSDIHDSVKTGAEDLGRRGGLVAVRTNTCGRGTSGLFWGAFLVLGGVALLLDHIGIISVDRLWRFWPLLLVCAGIPNIMSRERRLWGMLLWGAIEARRKPSTPPVGGDPRTTLSEMAVFGGIERRVTTQDFQGGHINAVFGGVEIDL